MRWLHQAAEQGHVQAQFGLGVLFMEGQGIPKNNAEAVRWFRLAATRGHIMAQHNLGSMYATGDGVPKDDIEAYAWFILASEQGSQLSKVIKKEIVKQMSRDQIAKAKKLSREYRKAYASNRENKK